MYDLAGEVRELEREKTESKILYFTIKRVFDFIFSLVCLIALSPVFILIALLIKLDSKGPVFFLHKRVGKNWEPIKLFKFRTMVTNAEELLKTLTIEQQREFKENFKLENDFRITKIGKILRKTSLDELPQIINILIGNMSLIGPRPVVTEELEKYGNNKSEFLSVTPGLTGWWACSGRSNITYEERIKLELYYVRNCSIKLDIKVFFKTIKSVLKKEGAK